jgi:hypothetical protein
MAGLYKSFFVAVVHSYFSSACATCLSHLFAAAAAAVQPFCEGTNLLSSQLRTSLYFYLFTALCRRFVAQSCTSPEVESFASIFLSLFGDMTYSCVPGAYACSCEVDQRGQVMTVNTEQISDSVAPWATSCTEF